MRITETEIVSSCCSAEVIEKLVGDESVSICSVCEHACATEEVCIHCGGTGEVTTFERVYPDDHIVAPIGTRPCICRYQIQMEEEYDDQEPRE